MFPQAHLPVAVLLLEAGALTKCKDEARGGRRNHPPG